VTEIWRDIIRYEGHYRVSNLGGILSLKKEPRLLKPVKNSRGYYIVTLHLNGNQISMRIHKLVAQSFLNHTPCGHKIIVDHIDNDTSNNRLDNLQLISVRENNSKDQKNRTSKYVGVTWHKLCKKWASQIKINYRNHHLGLFDCELEAAKAYQDKLAEL